MFLIFENQSSINKNRSDNLKHLRVFLSLLALVLLILPAAQVHAAPMIAIPGCRSAMGQTIDFSAAGEGPIQPDFFKRQSLVLTEGDFVGFIQGDESLNGPVAGTFHPAVCSLSLTVAPGVQGTAAYTLTAYSSSGEVVGSTTVIVTQDTGDPESGSFGYFNIELTNLSQRAETFTLESQFISSSFPHITQIPFGVSSITYTTAKGGQ
jgi:hypothetical protein